MKVKGVFKFITCFKVEISNRKKKTFGANENMFANIIYCTMKLYSSIEQQRTGN